MSGATIVGLLGVNPLSALGTLSTTMTVGAARDIGPPSTWDRGFANSAALYPQAFLQGQGSLVSTTFGAATVRAIYWESYVSGTSGGQVYVELLGIWGAGSVTSLTIGGTSQGTVKSPYYTYGNTLFPIGGSSVSNPFPTPGSTVSIVLS